MISRRNIRVKVMQLVYAFETYDENAGKTNPEKLLRQQLDKTTALFTFLIYTITEVARYAETDARVRASKNLVSAEDSNVNIKLAGNEILWQILENASFKNAITDFKTTSIDSDETVKKIYTLLVASPLYQTYISTQSRNRNTELDILKFIFTDLLLPNEDFTTVTEELFNNWDDDAEMMNQLVLQYLQKPAAYQFENLVDNEKWKFAKDLLTATIDKKATVTEMIIPKLKNWDAERIAALDMILMRMGVCEFLYFETIPPKVTINEYIDIAKDYSTAQSGHFVNGVLDNIHKELIAANKLHKVDFKQKAS